MKQNKALQRLERIVHTKLDKGWNAFTREEVEALVKIIHETRHAKRALAHRIHTSHGEAVGWYKDDEVGLHANGPAPSHAINLFTKPVGLAFKPGWRIPEGTRISGFMRTPDGELVWVRRKSSSPNDVMRIMHDALADLSRAYKVYERENPEPLCSESEAP